MSAKRKGTAHGSVDGSIMSYFVADLTNLTRLLFGLVDLYAPSSQTLDIVKRFETLSPLFVVSNLVGARSK